ncbi:winged helix-turn-helix domain-containing protein [Ornithinimicrobium sp. LYQ92]|uniref:winged helix-turn-helix domain-containing protein n=1 Tax=Serinicoccus sp. LYQ92 TaxID=3378798 RepID=UPI003851D101
MVRSDDDGERRALVALRRPGAQDPLVLVAGADLQARLDRAVALGWTGPVVVVGSLREALELRAVVSRETRVGTASVPGPDAPPGRTLLALDRVSRCARYAGTESVLTELEAGLLAALLRRPDAVVDYRTLGREVWGTEHLGDTSPVPPVLRRLRGKLRTMGAPGEVRTVRGVGLRLVLAPGVDPLVAATS